MGSHTNYISTAKENELVNGTIQILKDAKLRKKNNRQNHGSPGEMSKSKVSRSLSPNISKTNDRSLSAPKAPTTTTSSASKPIMFKRKA